jgi:hypothetical protein
MCGSTSCPSYTAQLQPAERLWPLIWEAVANDTFDTLTDLRRVVRRGRWLADDRITVQRATGFYWAVAVNS